MTDDADACRDALDDAKYAMLPSDDPDELEPDYPPEMSPEERVNHVLENEYPRWRTMEWIAAAADTEVESAESMVRERLTEGEVEIGTEGVRRNRYHVFYREVMELSEKVESDSRHIW